MFIGISEDRLHHILGVARKAYEISINLGYDEEFAQKMFTLGWLHDIGYEFSQNPFEHTEISADMLYSLIGVPLTDEQKLNLDAIRQHGKYPVTKSIEWRILTTADMLVDYDGKEVDVMTRLQHIKDRYGEHSDQYLTACDICYLIGLTAVNLASLIT